MKKLGKKLVAAMDTIEAYCYCGCDAGNCFRYLGSMNATASLGSTLQNRPGNTSDH